MTKFPSIYLRESLAAEIRSRGTNRSGIISRDLERLYTLYKRALREVPLSLGETCLIVDALNGALIDADTARLLWAHVEDGIRIDGLDRKWNVDGAALVEKLRGLNDLQAMAIVDAAERFWEMSQSGEVGLEEGVRKCFNLA